MFANCLVVVQKSDGNVRLRFIERLMTILPYCNRWC